MTGAERRKIIISMMRSSSGPISGGKLGTETGVSRQVIVQDIALLRTEGYSITATARGYLLDEPMQTERLIKVFHSDEQTAEEYRQKALQLFPGITSQTWQLCNVVSVHTGLKCQAVQYFKMVD